MRNGVGSNHEEQLLEQTGVGKRLNKALEIVLTDPPGTMGALWDGACPSLWPQGSPPSLMLHHHDRNMEGP